MERKQISVFSLQKTGAEERGKYDVTASGYRVSFKDDVNIIRFHIVIVAKLCEDTKSR